MTPLDPVTVLTDMRQVRQFRVELMEGVGEKADHMDVEQIAALDTALSALRLCQRLSMLPEPNTDGETCDELRALARMIIDARALLTPAEARALFPQEN